MKLLFYRYNNICEPDILAAFRQFGYEVLEFTAEMTRKDMLPSETVKAVSELLQQVPVDFVFSINFYPALSEVCNLFHIRYISWTVDSPVPELFTKSVRNEWNRTFLFDKADFEEVSALCADSPFPHVFYLPLCAAPRPKEELFQKTSEKAHRRYAHNIAFVGSLYTEKCKYDKAESYLSDQTRGYMDGVMSAQERVYGYHFTEDVLTDEIVAEFREKIPDFFALGEDSFFTDRMSVARYYLSYKISAKERIDALKCLSEALPQQSGYEVCLYTGSDTSVLPKVRNMGTAKTLTEMPLIFHNSDINLNMTAKGIRTGLPLRIFDILSCGGFVLTNYQTELPELFAIGEDLVAYTSMEELSDLARYYLEHEDERRAIAACGCETLKNRYTYEKQLGKLLLQAFEV